MGVFRKIADRTRELLIEPKNVTATSMLRIGGKTAAELSDEELDAELQRRRRERGGARGAEGPPRHAALKREQLRKWYSSLELKPGASRADIEAAYQSLSRKYHPDKHIGDPAKHRAATQLAQGLADAYHGLLAELDAGES